MSRVLNNTNDNLNTCKDDRTPLIPKWYLHAWIETKLDESEPLIVRRYPEVYLFVIGRSSEASFQPPPTTIKKTTTTIQQRIMRRVNIVYTLIIYSATKTILSASKRLYLEVSNNYRIAEVPQIEHSWRYINHNQQQSTTIWLYSIDKRVESDNVFHKLGGYPKRFGLVISLFPFLVCYLAAKIRPKR